MHLIEDAYDHPILNFECACWDAFFFPGCPLHYNYILCPTECMWILIANDRVGDRPIALSCMDIA